MLAAGVRNSAAVVIGQGGAEGMNGDAFPPQPDTLYAGHGAPRTCVRNGISAPGQAERARPTTLCEHTRIGVSGL